MSLPENYLVYDLKGEELLKYYGVSALVFFGLGFLFYRHIVISLMCTLIAVPLKRVYADYLKNKRLALLLDGFKEMLYSVSGSVASGRQMPYAIESAGDSLSVLFGEDSYIARELKHISHMYGNSHSDLDSLLKDFGRRSGLSEIQQFASAYSICRRNGGDAEAICLKSASLLLDKLSFQSEVNALVAQKKLDIAMLTAMPVLVLVFLNLVSFSYIQALYTTAAGRLIMSFCLGCIIVSLVWSIKIMEIEI